KILPKKQTAEPIIDTPQVYQAALQESRSLMTRAEKVIWLLFAATSSQLAFQWPYVVLMPGERTNLFSGLLCFLTLAAVWISKRGALVYKSPEFLVSAALTLMAVVSAFNIPAPP